MISGYKKSYEFEELLWMPPPWVITNLVLNQQVVLVQIG